MWVSNRIIRVKTKYPQIYKPVVISLFAEIRNILFSSLSNMTLENLADIVEDAHLGKASPNEIRMPLYKLSSSPSGASHRGASLRARRIAKLA